MIHAERAVVKHEKGLHARVAAMVVQQACEIQAKYCIDLSLDFKERTKVPVTSLMPLVSLSVKAGDEVVVNGNGEQPEQAVHELVQLLESDFVIEDVGAIHRIDTLLQDSAFTAEQVFNSMANGLVVTDENDIVTVFNPAAERILGFRATQVVGKMAQEVIPGSRLHIVASSKKPELACRQVILNSIIITNRTPIIVDGQGKGAVAIFEDISTLEKVTGKLQEVKELKERLQLVLESVQDGICVLDKEGMITYVNHAYLRIVGQEKGEIVGRNIREVSPEGARSRVLNSGQAAIGCISYKHEGITAVADVSPIMVDGQIMGVVSVVKNLIEVQSLVDKLNQVADKAEYLEHELKRTKRPGKTFEKFIGRSGKILDTLAVTEKAAEGNANVLIRGESGTGKELIAEGIHYASSRADGPLIRVNCAAIPQNLLESELFGYEKGSFTGAVKRKLGRFELAHKGTIFLDEIGDLEKEMQVKLLRVIQAKEFERVGGEETIKVNVRIIAATNRNLEQMLETGEFRQDLYYRLNVIPVFLPSLRERKEDIPLLVEHFLHKVSRELKKEIKGISWEALDVLIRYRWPGNVRELVNIIERMVTMADGPKLGLGDLPLILREQAMEANKVQTLPPTSSQEAILPWEEYEKKIIKMSLERYGSYNAAGKALGLTHKTVAAKAKKFGLEKVSAWEKRANE